MDTKGTRRKLPRKRTMMRKTRPRKPENNKAGREPQIIMEAELHHYYYSLVESIPVPEPTWSTTAPAVLCAAAAPLELPEPPEDALQLELAAENEGESYAAAEAWWVGFLKSLDCKSGKGGAARENVVVVESCKEVAAATVMDSSGTFPEDWLCFPAAEDHSDEPATKSNYV